MPFDSMEDKHVPPTFQQATAAAMPQFSKSFEVYGVSNPHPGYGTDPNIINCFGHTKYPMAINRPDGTIVVNNEEEHNAALGIVKELKQDGPTVAEYVEHGYDPKGYPPKGHTSKIGEQEIKAAIEAFKPKMSW